MIIIPITRKNSPHSPINVQFTSGTTGRPKAAALTHFAIVNNARSIVEMGNKYCTADEVKMADENTILINNLPLYHVFSFTSGAILGCYAKGKILHSYFSKFSTFLRERWSLFSSYSRVSRNSIFGTHLGA